MNEASTEQAAVMENGRILPENDTLEDLTDIEIPPQDDWFYETTGPEGEPLVYLRFKMTGWKTRRIGPFEARETALWALDILLMKFDEALSEYDTEEKFMEEMVKFPLQKRDHAIFLEDPYTFQPPFKKPKKGA